jgi:hypothetical protein
MTLHPQGKAGVRIERTKYDTIKGAILDAVGETSTVSFGALTDVVRRQVGDRFSGSVSWYVTTVKLDLEARGLIERVPDMKPQHLRRAGSD